MNERRRLRQWATEWDDRARRTPGSRWNPWVAQPNGSFVSALPVSQYAQVVLPPSSGATTFGVVGEVVDGVADVSVRATARASTLRWPVPVYLDAPRRMTLWPGGEL